VAAFMKTVTTFVNMRMQLFGVLRDAAPALVDPGTTAEWEMQLDAVVTGEADHRRVKADDIDSFNSFRITSFDTTSPLLRAFKDKKSNYYLPDKSGRLRYYTAIRLPQALENNKLMRLVKQGTVPQEKLVDLEHRALEHLRAYDAGRATLNRVLNSVLAYGSLAELGAPIETLPGAVFFLG
jgi:hypothetical protein